MPFLNPYNVLWIVIWSMVLFVVAPHLDVVSKPAARTLRIGSCAILLNLGTSVGAMIGRVEFLWGYLNLIHALCTALFWGSFAVAAWQLLQGAPRRKELQ